MIKGCKTRCEEHLKDDLRRKKNCSEIKDRLESPARSHREGVQRSEELGTTLNSAQKSVVTLQRAVSVELWGWHQIAMD